MLEVENQLQKSLIVGKLTEDLGDRNAAKLLYSKALSKAKQLASTRPQIFAVYQAELLTRLRTAPEANEAYDRAEQAGDQSFRLLLGRAELYLLHRAYAQAEVVIHEALLKEPKNPRAQLLAARLAFEGHYSFVRAEEHLRTLFDVDTSHADGRSYEAQLYLRQNEMVAAKESLKLIGSPRNQSLEAMSTRVAYQLLSDQPKKYQEALKSFHDIFPASSRPYVIAAQITEYRLRYRESEKLLRKAIRLDRLDGSLHAQLGLNLIRSGNEARGLVSLQRAHELEPFDIRVTNLLNLFEQEVEQNYIEEKIEGVHYRFPLQDAAVLRRYLPSLIAQARLAMEKSYEFKPKEPLQVEIYANKEDFAVRTSGIPQSALAGVCFGRKVATISPRASSANLGMTLWHEIAHVYHLGLSEHRVPRFLSEGLAEWETARLNRGWQREMDRVLSAAMRDRAIPSLELMSKAFSHAQNFEDIAIAYYASGKLAGFLSDRIGSEALGKILSELAKKRELAEVLEEYFTEATPQADSEFNAFLKRDLKHFLPQALDASGMSSAQPRANESILIRRARLALKQGHVDEFEALQDELAVAFPQSVQDLLLGARVALRREQVGLALDLLEKAASVGPPSFEVEALRARLLLEARPLASQEAHQSLLNAHELDPSAQEPLRLLADYYKSKSRPQLELEYIRKWAFVAEDNEVVQERYLTLLTNSLLNMGLGIAVGNKSESELRRELREVTQWRIWANLLNPELHYTAARAWLAVGDEKAAYFEMESALLSIIADNIDSVAAQGELLARWEDEAERQGSRQAVVWAKHRRAKFRD